MSSKQDKRRNFITRMFGQKTSDELAEALQQLQTALDGVGVDRKEYNGERSKAILEDLATQIDDLLGTITDNPPEELRNQIIALVMGAVADTGMVEDQPEQMAEDVPPEEEDQPMPEQMMELTEQVKALAKESTAIYEDMAEFIPAFIAAAKSVQELVPLVKQAGRIEDIAERVKALETAYRQRPRQASQSAETLVENDKLLAEMKKGTEGVKMVLGVPVKE